MKENDILRFGRVGQRMSDWLKFIGFNRLKWGDDVFERGIDKTKIQIVSLTTGEIRVLKNDQN